MTYGNKRKYKRKTKGGSKVTMATVKKAIKSSLSKVSELKNLDVTHSQLLPTSAAAAYHDAFLYLAQGSSGFTRDGDSIYATSLQATIRLDMSNAVSYSTRLIWLYIKDGVKTTDLQNNFYGLPVFGYLPRRIDQKYKVLSDKTYTFTANDERDRIIKHVFKLNNKVTYDGASTPPVKGQIVCYAYTDAIVSGNSRVDINTRLYYRDN